MNHIINKAVYKYTILSKNSKKYSIDLEEGLKKTYKWYFNQGKLWKYQLQEIYLVMIDYE